MIARCSPPASASRALIQRSLLWLLGRRPRATTPQFGSGSGNSAPSQLPGAAATCSRRNMSPLHCPLSRKGESSTNRQPYLRQCPRRSSNSQPTIPIARCGSGTESSGSPSRHGPLRPDRGGRLTSTTYAWESTIVDPVLAIPLPFRTSPSRTCPERSTASANSAGRSSTPAIGGPYAGTPRAARSRWPPRPQSRNSTGTIAARAKRNSGRDVAVVGGGRKRQSHGVVGPRSAKRGGGTARASSITRVTDGRV